MFRPTTYGGLAILTRSGSGSITLPSGGDTPVTYYSHIVDQSTGMKITSNQSLSIFMSPNLSPSNYIV